MANRCLFLCSRRLSRVCHVALSTSQNNIPRGTWRLQPSTNRQRNGSPRLLDICKQFSTVPSVGEGLRDPTSWEDRELTEEDWLGLKSDWKEDKIYGHMDFSYHILYVARICKKHSKHRRAKSILDHARREMGRLPQPLFDLYCLLCSKSKDLEGLRYCLDAVREEPSLLYDGNVRSLMRGVCKTEDWRTDALELLRVVAEVDLPQSSPMLEPLLVVASKNGDVDLVSRLLDGMQDNSLIPTDAACASIFSSLLCKSEDDSTNLQCQELVFKLLNHLRIKRHYISKRVASALSVWFASIPGATWKSAFTGVSRGGKCRTCGHSLESVTLAPAEFEVLRKQITEKVIFGADIFQKTRPDEFEAFTHFVKEGGPYDIVVDGLNVAFLLNKKTAPSIMLRQVIVYLVQVCGYKVLVLGRHHMSTWPRRDMNAVTDLADCFFTEDISQDDPFMLYATLHSGPKCMYLTNDMLRDHKALLDPAVHLSFIQWQRTHQMKPVTFANNKLICKAIRQFDTVVQSTAGGWHIPFDDEDKPRLSYHVPADWLCITKG